MRGIEEVLAEFLLLFGILRHSFRISQNVEGAPHGEASAEASRMSQEQQNHNEEEGFDFGNNVAWFLTGAFIGAAVAILYAPKSGKETRQFLADKVQQSKDAVAESSNNIVEASKDMFERGRQLVDDAADLFERGRKLVKG
jgi:alpha/beta superfamily hydrolase